VQLDHPNVELIGEDPNNMSLVAKRDLALGELVIENEPISYVVANNSIDYYCSCCNKKNPSLTCSGCNYVKYCSDLCKEKDSYLHSSECAESLKSLKWDTRYILRLIKANNVAEINDHCE